jgi:CheY-like chemotaxis protein
LRDALRKINHKSNVLGVCEVAESKAKMLVVDDDPAIRDILSVVLTEIGYEVRAVEDGFAALIEIRKNAPDILLSDLNMPGMSGFELLCVVRHQFPVIHTVAMSSMFSSSEVPSGIAADAFYQKGTGVNSLLRLLQTLPRHDRVSADHTTVLQPLFPLRDDYVDLGDLHEMISYAECLRMVSMVQSQTISQMREVVCPQCSGLIQAAFEPISDDGSQSRVKENHSSALPPLHGIHQLDN